MPRIPEERSRAQRARVVEAAITVFAARGYAPATIDAVAAEAGLSKGAVYTYVSSKEELFVEASRHVFERRFQALARPGDRGDGSLESLVQGFTGSLLRSDPSFLRLWVEGFLLAHRIPALADLKVDYHRRFAGLLADALRAAQATGADVGPALDVPMAVEAAMALADGLMLYTLVPGLGPDADAAHRLLTGGLRLARGVDDGDGGAR